MDASSAIYVPSYFKHALSSSRTLLSMVTWRLAQRALNGTLRCIEVACFYDQSALDAFSSITLDVFGPHTLMSKQQIDQATGV